MDILRLTGKTALVTGGSRGIGFAISQKFAKNGANCILLATKQSLIDRALEQLPRVRDNQIHKGVVFDVGSGKQITESELGNPLDTVDIVVNSAGITQQSLLVTTSPDQIAREIDINLRGTILMSQSFLRSMIRRRDGVIINMASILADRPVAGTTVYAAAKAGIIGFTKALAREMGSKNIRVNAISPGLVDTDMTKNVTSAFRDHVVANSPLARPSSLDDIAEAALYLASAPTVTGQVLNVDSGYTA
jgi:3-oxoacyl-[acyl-carrier protein] reductase